MKWSPPSFATTAVVVTLLHLAAMVWFAKQGATTIAQPRQKRPLMVATRTPAPAPASSPQVVKEVPALPKKSPPRAAATVKKAPARPAKPAPTKKQEAVAPKRRERLAAAAKTLAKIEREELQVPLKAEVTPATGDGRTAQLITALKRMLRLPEYGAVKVEVTLGGSGVVKAIRIVSSASKRNSAYVVDQLQGATLLPAASGGDETLLLTLTNEALAK